MIAHAHPLHGPSPSIAVRWRKYVRSWLVWLLLAIVLLAWCEVAAGQWVDGQSSSIQSADPPPYPGGPWAVSDPQASSLYDTNTTKTRLLREYWLPRIYQPWLGEQSNWTTIRSLPANAAVPDSIIQDWENYWRKSMPAADAALIEPMILRGRQTSSYVSPGGPGLIGWQPFQESGAGSGIVRRDSGTGPKVLPEGLMIDGYVSGDSWSQIAGSTENQRPSNLRYQPIIDTHYLNPVQRQTAPYAGARPGGLYSTPQRPGVSPTAAAARPTPGYSSYQPQGIGGRAGTAGANPVIYYNVRGPEPRTLVRRYADTQPADDAASQPADAPATQPQ